MRGVHGSLNGLRKQLQSLGDQIRIIPRELSLQTLQVQRHGGQVLAYSVVQELPHPLLDAAALFSACREFPPQCAVFPN